jgi:hypothetical protein
VDRHSASIASSSIQDCYLSSKVLGRMVHIANGRAIAQSLLDLVDSHATAMASIWTRRAGFWVDLAAPVADKHRLAHADTAAKHCTATPRSPAK